MDNLAQQLRELEKLHASGALSDDEFGQAKALLLDGQVHGGDEPGRDQSDQRDEDTDERDPSSRGLIQRVRTSRYRWVLLTGGIGLAIVFVGIVLIEWGPGGPFYQGLKGLRCSPGCSRYDLSAILASGTPAEKDIVFQAARGDLTSFGDHLRHVYSTAHLYLVGWLALVGSTVGAVVIRSRAGS